MRIPKKLFYMSLSILIFSFCSAKLVNTFTPNTLRDLANEVEIEIGTAFDGYQIYNTKWKEVVVREFNLGVIHWGVYWSSIEPSQGTFDFAIPDLQVRFCRENGLEIRGHPLVFPSSAPEWLTHGEFTSEELNNILRIHISQVINHFKGYIKQWVVVNEPYLYPYRVDDIYYEHFGYDYIEYAFQIARDTDPSIELIYNDVNNHYSDSETTMLTKEIIQKLKSKNLIDGVGLQMHLDGDNLPDKLDVITTMKSYGIPVYITEFDVDLRNIPGSVEDRFLLQAEIYKSMLEACLESGVCESFTVWGIGDKYSWLEQSSINEMSSCKADPTPFDDDLQPKPAYYSLYEALEKYAKN